MPEQIKIALKTPEVATFQAFLALPENQEFRLVEQRPAPNLFEDGLPYHAIVTIEAQEAWYFFCLGARWADFQQEGGPNNG